MRVFNVRFNKGETIIIFFIILVIVTGAYWFGYRPYHIKRDCAKLSDAIATDNGRSEPIGPAFSSDYQGDYQLCLNARGL